MVCTSTICDTLCSPYNHASNSPVPWTKCSVLIVMSLKSPGFIKYQPRCLNLFVAKTSRPQRTCEAISVTCFHLSHSGLFSSTSLNRCPFKWQCPVSSPVIILSWFLFRLSNSPALLADGFLRNSFPWKKGFNRNCQNHINFILVICWSGLDGGEHPCALTVGIWWV